MHRLLAQREVRDPRKHRDAEHEGVEAGRPDAGEPQQASNEYWPGPVSARAAAPAPYSSGTSMPFDIANRPLGQCTLIAATIITATMSAGPTGPKSPAATSTPLTTSASRRERREEASGAESERVEHAGDRGEAVAAEPAEELLGAVRRHERAETRDGRAVILYSWK